MSDPRAGWNLVASFAEIPRFHRVYHLDGLWVAAAGEYGLRIATATDPEGPWTLHDELDFWPIELAFGDGYWVSAKYELYTATDPTGTWTANTSIPGYTNNVAYADGVWVATTFEDEIYTATDPTGTWTLADTLGTHDFAACRVAYVGGEWVATRQTVEPGTPNGWEKAWIYTATDPTGTWTLRSTIGTETGDLLITQGGGPSIIDLSDEGYYFIAFGYYNNVQGDVRYSTSFDGPWTKKENADPSFSGFAHVAVSPTQYLWIPGAAYVSDSIEDDLEATDLNLDVEHALYADGSWVAVAQTSNGEAGIWVAGEGGDGWGLLL